jgi:3-oxoacyl-[acyl-carrier-protein] synthase II
MQLALDDANLRPEDVDYVNAHGTSTVQNDRAETAAIKKVFGDRARDVSISSTKSVTGHLLGAAGSLELVACVKAIEENVVPPTINLDNPAPDCDLDYTPNRAVKREINVAMSNSFGFGGHNAVLVVRRVE